MTPRSRTSARRSLPQVHAAIAAGGLDTASRERMQELVVDLVVSFWPPSNTVQTNPVPPATRVSTRVLDWLAAQPGVTWQQRWDNSGATESANAWLDLAGLNRRAIRVNATYVLNALLVLRVVRPTTTWLLQFRRMRLWDDYAVYHDTELMAQLEVLLAKTGDPRTASTVTGDLVRLCLSTGRGLPELTVNDFLRARAEMKGTKWVGRTLHPAFFYARQLGLMPDQPMQLPVTRGPKTPTEFVNGYGVRDPNIRAALIEYLTERAVSCDYRTLENLANHLVRLFWVDLEAHEPAPTSLTLTKAQAAGWRERVQLLDDGRPRVGWADVVSSVRGFYLDLAAWAIEDPARWVSWVAPCPVPPRASRDSLTKRRSRIAIMQGRTLTLAPLLPALSKSIAEHLGYYERLLAAAASVEVGKRFTFEGQQWTRRPHASDWGDPLRPTILATDPHGQRVRIAGLEERAFWTWAAFEVLRHSGIRIEELLELTHLSILPFRKRSGEIVPLLQITPSKTDRERVIPASPELAHVLSRIVARHAAVTGDGSVPLMARFDENDRVLTAPMPFLFQRRWKSGRDQAMSSGSLRQYLVDAANRAELRTATGEPIHFSPHDFRRLWLTNLVGDGFPLHIAARLAGHESLNTTNGYVAVYPHEVVDRFTTFIARRRELRPSEEYRKPTPAELADFAEHFGKRRVELGNCVRPYGTSCIHEHACVRCDMLQVTPDAGPRLIAMESDLRTRLDTARDKAWLGDVDQLHVTLTRLHDKQEQLSATVEHAPAVQDHLLTARTPVEVLEEHVPLAPAAGGSA